MLKNLTISAVHGSQTVRRKSLKEHSLGITLAILLVGLVLLLVVIQLDLFEDKLLVFVNLERVKLEIEIEILDWLPHRFVLCKVQTLHVGVRKSLINRDSLFWVKNEHFLQQIDSLFIGSLEKFSETLAARLWQFNHEFFYSLVLDLTDYSICGPSNEIANHHHLFLLGLGRQKGSSAD